MYIDSAIYIDFDNIFTSLRYCYSPQIAENFVYFVDRWQSFLSSAGIHGHKRVFRKKIIYLNPCVYSQYRTEFLKFGFRVVECPPLTKMEKTATDINMTVNIMSDLYTKDYQDYILISGDADFSPVLFHINELSKNSILLGIGHVSSIYRSMATYQVNRDEFVSTFEKEISPYLTQTNTIKVDNSSDDCDVTTPKRFGESSNKPMVRIIKKPSQDEDSVKSSLDMSSKKERNIRLTSLSDLPNAFNRDKDSDIDSEKSEFSTKKSFSLGDLNLPILSNDVRVSIFKYSISYATDCKSPKRYVWSMCQKIQNKYSDVSSDEIKRYLEYLPYDDLVLEDSARKVFIKNFILRNTDLIEKLGITAEELEEILVK